MTNPNGDDEQKFPLSYAKAAELCRRINLSPEAVLSRNKILEGIPFTPLPSDDESPPDTFLPPSEVLLSSQTANLTDVVVVGTDRTGLCRVFSSSGDRALILAKLRGAVEWIERGGR